jgi:hypothetical protein
VGLPVDIAVESAVVLGGASVAVKRLPKPKAPAITPKFAAAQPILRESAILLVLYAAWRKLGELPTFGIDKAFSRAEDLWRWERWMHLPNEATIQHWLTHAPVFLRFGNLYYIIFHVAPVGIFLIWLFVRHRDEYPKWRNIFAGASLVCILIQTIPVAPPRMFPQFGFIDAGQVYGPQVYDSAGSGLAGQLAAMPSMHVLWAVAIGASVMSVSRSRWRWLGFAHAVLTLYAVTVSGYHWLADGIAGAALVFIGIGLYALVERKRARRETSVRAAQANEVSRPSGGERKEELAR